MPRVRKPAGDETKRRTASTRLTPATMAKLDAAIAENGRSLAQEIEARIERSFTIEDELGGRDGLRFHSLAAWYIQLIEHQTGKRWTEDLDTFYGAKEAIERAFGQAHPRLPDDLLDEFSSMKAQLDEAKADLARTTMETNERFGRPRLTLRSLVEKTRREVVPVLDEPLPEDEIATETASFSDDDRALVEQHQANLWKAAAAKEREAALLAKLKAREQTARGAAQVAIMGAIDYFREQQEG